MKPRLAFAAVLAICGTSLPVLAGGDGLRWRVEAADGGPAVTAESVQSVADLLKRRCAHAGLDVTDVKAVDGGIQVLPGPKSGPDDVASIRRLAGRSGAIEFRVRADVATESAARDARLQAGAEPPAGFEWRLPEEGVTQFLVETPEKAAAAALEAAKAKSPPDDAAVKAAEAALGKAKRDLVFTNADVAETSVQRSMSSHGAARFLRIAIRFELKEDRRAAFKQFTGSRIGRGLAVVVDGKVHVCPTIKASLPGMGELTGPGGGYTDEQAQELAALFVAGPLPFRLVPVTEK